MRPLAEDRGVVLLERYPADMVLVRGSEQQLRLVVSSLVANALDAVSEGDVVELALATEGTTAELTVRDTGPGIPAELKDRIFELNFSTKPGGSGLGLALARRETERLGGRIHMVPRAAAGTTLRISLPRII
jgi:two-component system, NtrC family, nitrogen regulation sensor histidine kinase NtrY